MAVLTADLSGQSNKSNILSTKTSKLDNLDKPSIQLSLHKYSQRTVLSSITTWLDSNCRAGKLLLQCSLSWDSSYQQDILSTQTFHRLGNKPL